MRLELYATPEEVMRAVEALQKFGDQHGVGDRDLFAVALVLEEAATNIVNHALKRNSTQKFQVSVQHTGSEMVIELRDRGPEFDPTLAAPGKLPEDEPVSGWGIQLVRRYTQEIRYRREAGENILRLTRHLGPGRQNPFLTCTTDKLKTKTDMPLEITIQKSGGADTATAILTGSLDTATAPELERQLAPVLAGPIKEFVFDLAKLKFISSAGLRVFSATRKLLRQRGGQVTFVHLQPQIREVFEIIQALPGVAIFKDTAEMDDYLAARQHSHEKSAGE